MVEGRLPVGGWVQQHEDLLIANRVWLQVHYSHVNVLSEKLPRLGSVGLLDTPGGAAHSWCAVVSLGSS